MARPAHHSVDAPLVWDGYLRALHWLMAVLVAACFGSVLTRSGLLHAWAGHALLVVLLARLAWAFRGPPSARFTDFFHPPRAVRAYALGLLPGRPLPRFSGHTPLGGPVAAGQLALLAVVALTGVLVLGGVEFSGPLWMLGAGLGDRMIHLARRIHRVCADLSLLLLAVHLCGVVAGTLAGGENLVATMISGRKRVRPSPERNPET